MSPIDALLRGMKRPAFGGRYLCPVDDCAWQLDVPDPKCNTSGSVDWTQSTVKLSMSGVDPQEVEQRLRLHFESHDVVDWAKTVQRLTFELAAIERQAEEPRG
jgi:hypothetical protein